MLIFFIIVVSIIAAMIGLIITNTSNNNDITNSDSNWNPDANTWDNYYKNNCPPNKLYNLTDYKDDLKNTTLVNTSENPKQSFTINDLLNEIDGELIRTSVNIPNSFFNHLPLNPAISIKIDDNNALLSNFTISMPKYNEQKTMNIEIITTDVGLSYHLEPSVLTFNFIVKNDNKPVLININDLDLTIPEETVSMVDITKGTNTEVINCIDSDISQRFINKIPGWRPITKSDFTINYDEIKQFANYQKPVTIAIIISADTSDDVITGTLNINVNVKGINTIKSLNSFKSTLEQDKSIINESITLDNPNVSIKKIDIEKHIISQLNRSINDYGKITWHQNFTDNDYTITTNATDGIYNTPKTINVTIIGKNQLKDTINIDVTFRTVYTTKSLNEFQSYLNKDEFTKPNPFAVNDDTNVQKDDINNLLINLFATGIKDYGKITWHQFFTDDDYTITSNFQGGNCQGKQTSINITIIGKNQLKDTINITIIMECHNESSNEQTFTNKKIDCSELKPISLLSDIGGQGIYYPIKNNDDSVTDLLLSNAKDDLNKFSKLDSPTINLAVHANFAIDDDNFQLDFQADIDPIIIKNADEVKLFTDCNHISNYEHVTSIAIVIKYKDSQNKEQELKMNKVMNNNFSSNCQLTFNSISTAIKIKSFR